MAFYVYVLKCADGSYYTGHTDDLEVRMQQHMSGAILLHGASFAARAGISGSVCDEGRSAGGRAADKRLEPSEEGSHGPRRLE
ncbi:GIY-YIG nuclease family protein [Uliginosibacterium paludis]|uniref:GIY-YIG nuclease family protein n=1 Tax=Uliginosibacterium paludis TaxID=1615952 RepID=A0ABV2CW35_9RHOO